MSKRKFAGSATYDCKYQKAWEAEYPIQGEPNQNTKFRCIPCQRLVTCKHQGKKDVEIHCNSDLHKKQVIANRTQGKLTFKPVGQTTNTQKLAHRAEAKTVEFMVQHNISIETADHLIPLYKDMFKDSQVAKSMACARTKSTQILNKAMQPEARSLLVEYMQTEPFAFSTDGSNDNGLAKMNPVIVYIFDVNRSHKVDIKFYDMCMTSGEHAGKAATIFDAINDKFVSDKVPWLNCVGVGVDNTNTNIGCNNSIKSRVLEYNPDCYFNGCPCHLAHISASNGNDVYAEMTGFNCEDFVVDLYYFFDKSTKRKGVLMEYLQFCDLEWAALVRHISVRWLSLEMAIGRALQKHSGLKSYFQSVNEKDARFKRLKAAYNNDPKTELHLLNLSAILPMFTNFNKLLQREDPSIHLLYPTITALCKKIAQRIIKPDVLAATSPLELDLEDEDVFLDLEDVYMGLAAKQLLNKSLEDGSITGNERKNIQRSIVASLKTSLAYIYKKFPISDPVITNAIWLDVTKRLSSKFAQVEFYVEKFKKQLGELNGERLFEEFSDYQTLTDDEIGKHAFSEALTRNNDDEEQMLRGDSDAVQAPARPEYRIDVLWWHLGNMKEPGSSINRFPNLSKLARLVLVIPHSNAGSERVFSVVRANKTDQRNRLSYEGTLTSSIMVKMDRPDNKDTPCYKYEPSPTIIARVPKVTREYNLEHPTKDP